MHTFTSITLTTAFVLLTAASAFAQSWSFPIRLEDHHSYLLDYEPEQPTTIQEWKRERGKALTKGILLQYDEQGIRRIALPEGEDWSYTYDKLGRPLQLTITDPEGEITRNRFSYQWKYYAQETSSTGSPAMRKVMGYYDDDGRVFEENTFERADKTGKYELEKRVIRTYMGRRDDRVKGEMWYSYHPDRKDGLTVHQQKVNYAYHPKSGELVEKTYYAGIHHRPEESVFSSRFVEVVATETYTYDTTGKRLLAYEAADPDGPIAKRTYSYDDTGRLREIKMVTYEAANRNRLATEARSVFDEEEELASYYFEGGKRARDYRSSFVWK